MANSDMFGWDLLYKVTEPQLRNNYDVIVCLTHWTLIHRGFRCVGVGEDTTFPNLEEQTELLPEGWNVTNKISLRYISEGKLYLFSAIKNENNLIINLNRVVDNYATGTCIDNEVVKDIRGNLSRMIPDSDEVITKIKRELIEPMFAVVPSKEAQTQTAQSSSYSQRPEPRSSNSYFVNPQPREMQPPSRPFFSDPLREVGRSDLDPFAPGGGMLYQPPGLGPRIPAPGFDSGLPRGAVPPGARFDPFRPPGSGGPRPPHSLNPDHDHLPPPGYDDMFM